MASTNRSVINHEQFTNELLYVARGRPKHVKEYVKTVARKYYLKHWDQYCTIQKPTKGPKFFGFKSSDGSDYEPMTITIKTELGPIIKEVEKDSELYTMIQRGDVVVLDMESFHIVSRELRPILDWMTAVYATPKNLSSIQFEVALVKAKEWHEEQARIAKSLAESERQKLAVASITGTTPVFEIGLIDRRGEPETKEIWYLYHLASDEALQYEGNKLHHCVGNGFYWSTIKRGLQSIWSLRQSLMEPTLTITFDKDKETEGKPRVIVANGLMNSQMTTKQIYLLQEPIKMLGADHNIVPLHLISSELDKFEVEYCKKIGEIPAFFK